MYLLSSATAVVALTGSTGLIGRQLTPALLAAGYSVRVLRRRSTLVPPFGCQVVFGDLRDERSLADLLRGTDAVIHLAGIAHTRLVGIEQQAEARAINVGAARAVALAAKAAGVKHMVFVSSAHVYRGQQGLDIHEEDCKDDGAGYAAMKLEAEEHLKQEAGAALRLLILRPCLTYGPGVCFNLQALLHAVQSGRYVHPGGADVMRSFASVDTVAAATLHLLRATDRAGTYNVADRSPVSLRAWVDCLALELGVRKPRAVPVSLLRGAAIAGDLLQKAGVPAPLTTNSLHKLTAPFTLNLDRLAATGFTWPGTAPHVLQEMVHRFQADEQEGRPRS